MPTKVPRTKTASTVSLFTLLFWQLPDFRDVIKPIQKLYYQKMNNLELLPQKQYQSPKSGWTKQKSQVWSLAREFISFTVPASGIPQSSKHDKQGKVIFTFHFTARSHVLRARNFQTVFLSGFWQTLQADVSQTVLHHARTVLQTMDFIPAMSTVDPGLRSQNVQLKSRWQQSLLAAIPRLLIF